MQGLWDGAYDLSSLISKKPRKSMHFANVFTKAALSAQLWKILSVGLAPPTQQSLTNEANFKGGLRDKYTHTGNKKKW